MHPGQPKGFVPAKKSVHHFFEALTFWGPVLRHTQQFWNARLIPLHRYVILLSTIAKLGIATHVPCTFQHGGLLPCNDSLPSLIVARNYSGPWCMLIRWYWLSKLICYSFWTRPKFITLISSFDNSRKCCSQLWCGTTNANILTVQ